MSAARAKARKMAAIGKAANGRWWAQCTLPCNHYSSCLRTRDEARAVAAVHQLHHSRRGVYR